MRIHISIIVVITFEFVNKTDLHIRIRKISVKYKFVSSDYCNVIFFS